MENRIGKGLLCTLTLLLASVILTGCRTPQPGPTATPKSTPIPAETSPASATPKAANSIVTPPAFPGAEGFGAETPGGRGGRVIEVTNLNDAGSGSLREALEAKGPRIIVFRVAGTIELQSTLVVANPYVTIAGQTAPGAGVTLRGVNAAVEALLLIQTHDVVVRFLMFRAGPPSAGDGLEVFAYNKGEAYNVVIDHNSLSWAVNRNLATWYDAHDISIQWNIFSEGLNCSIHPKGCHSKGVLLGGPTSDENGNQPGAFDISLHHNLMAHNVERNPYIKAAGVIEVVNNVVYNPSGTFSHIDLENQVAPDLVNYIANYYKAGPNTEVKFGVKVINTGAFGAQIFAKGNIGPGREDDSQPEINILDPGSRQFAVSAPFLSAAITTVTASEAYKQVLANAGANLGLACDGAFFTRRDAIDQRIIADVEAGTGKIIDDPSEVGGWLNIPSSPPCSDTDHDGMPDAWEQKFGLDPNNPSDASTDADGDGYSNLEEFLNGTNPNMAS